MKLQICYLKRRWMGYATEFLGVVLLIGTGIYLMVEGRNLGIISLGIIGLGIISLILFFIQFLGQEIVPKNRESVLYGLDWTGIFILLFGLLWVLCLVVTVNFSQFYAKSPEVFISIVVAHIGMSFLIFGTLFVAYAKENVITLKKKEKK